jgi:hypothetical protein
MGKSPGNIAELLYLWLNFAIVVEVGHAEKLRQRIDYHETHIGMFLQGGFYQLNTFAELGR